MAIRMRQPMMRFFPFVLSFLISFETVTADILIERLEPTYNLDDVQQYQQNDCSLFWYNWDVYTGRDYATDEVLFENSIVKTFTQHSRRPFPTWNRASGRFLLQQDDGPNNFIYAPALNAPLTRCDPRHYNVRRSKDLGTFVLDRMVRAGQPLIASDCSPANDDEQRDPPADVPLETLRKDAFCLDTTEINVNGTAYAKRPLERGHSIILGSFQHLHRQELLRSPDQTYEEVVQYCFGRTESDLLLLPLFPIIGNVQHDHENPNLQLVWNRQLHDEEIFVRPFHEWNVGTEDPWLLPMAELVTVRDIVPGEVLTMDFGKFWGTTTQERQLPDGFFPEAWLQTEQRTAEWPEISTPSLHPGEVRPVRLNNGDALGTYHHRVGLPPTLAPKMAEWAENMGLYNLLQRYVTDDSFALPPMGEERNYFNGGRWWTRRFGNFWLSNLHMMSPDDDEATKQMHEALHVAGFDTVLKGIGQHFNLTTLTAYFPCFLVVSHCTRAHIHKDTDHPTMFNLILPLHQADDSPELILARDDQTGAVPYKYEPEAGILLGKTGMHGTAPADYRHNGGYRIAMSVSMGDFSKDDDVVRQFIASWEDPPYPNYVEGQVRHSLLNRRHWSRDNPNVSMGNDFVWFGSENPPDLLLPNRTNVSQMEVRQFT